jgi:multiple sugar transport system permease protein
MSSVTNPTDTSLQVAENELAASVGLGHGTKQVQGLPDPEAGQRRKSKSTRNRMEKLMTHLGLLFISIGFLLPFVWMVSTSLKTLDNTMAFPPQFIPKPAVPENYLTVLTSQKIDFPLFTRNTLIIAVLTVLGTTISSAIVAYGFAKINFKGRGVLFALMLATMMIPFPVTMVSLFTLFRWMGDNTPIQMLGTFRPLWVPAWFASAFNVFLLRQFFIGIPNELSESARLDGCSEWQIFSRIVLPLARPALTVVALFTFMGAWNDFLGPLVYLQYPEQYTLALGLQTYQSQQGGTEWNFLMAASVMILMPVIILFFLAQKTFIEGIATTGSKG